MARKLGISVTALGNIERGKTMTVSKDRLEIISEVLKMPKQAFEDFDPENFNGFSNPNIMVDIFPGNSIFLNKSVEELIEMQKLTHSVIEKFVGLLENLLDMLSK